VVAEPEGSTPLKQLFSTGHGPEATPPRSFLTSTLMLSSDICSFKLQTFQELSPQELHTFIISLIRDACPA
jgi:hypothetical protein